MRPSNTQRRSSSGPRPAASTPLRHQPMIFLIAPPVIRIWPKSFRISANPQSNRHKTPPFSLGLIDGSSSPTPGTCLSPTALATRHLSVATSALIGPPVIRIRPKSFRISANSRSNRHETPSFATLEPLTSNFELLIPNRNTTSYRKRRKCPAINHLAISNRNWKRTFGKGGHRTRAGQPQTLKRVKPR